MLGVLCFRFRLLICLDVLLGHHLSPLLCQSERRTSHLRSVYCRQIEVTAQPITTVRGGAGGMSR